MPTVETTPLADLIMPSRKLFLESSLARQNRDSSVADSLDVYTAECRAPEKPVVFYNVTSKTRYGRTDRRHDCRSSVITTDRYALHLQTQSPRL